jgi:hypothetical protein
MEGVLHETIASDGAKAAAAAEMESFGKARDLVSARASLAAYGLRMERLCATLANCAASTAVEMA